MFFFDKLVIVIVSSMQAITSDIFYLPGEQRLMLLPRSWGQGMAYHSSISPTSICQNCTHHISCYMDCHWEPAPFKIS